MAEYIDKAKLKRHYGWWNNENQQLFDTIVDVIPVEDVKPVVRGMWLNPVKGKAWTTIATCSVCGERQQLECINFCPHCGADMGVKTDRG